MTETVKDKSMEFEKMKEIVKIQQMPRMHVGYEEKIPTKKFGNKTITLNLSFHVEHATEDNFIKAYSLMENVASKIKYGLDTNNLKGDITIGDQIVGSVANEDD